LLRVVGRALKIAVIVSLSLSHWLSDRIGVRWLWWRLTGGGARRERLPTEALVRQAFELMGPTFVKLGQVVASSPGLFPKRYSDEFQRCLDEVPSFEFAIVRQTIEDELGQSLETLFTSVEDRPLGSASIAQVHGAVLPDGRSVVIKVQRPGIGEVVDADLWWMRRGAWLLERLFLTARLANLRGVIDDFDQTIHEEIDFKREAANLTEFNLMMAKHQIEDVRAPKPVDDLVSQRVLVMERFFGFKVDDVEGIAGAGIDPEIFLRKALRAWLLTVVLHGFFHGDAHAGNLMMLPEGPACGFLDFGIIGRFDDRQRNQVLHYVLAFAVQDYTALAQIMVEIGAVSDAIEMESLIADLERVYSPLLSKAMGEIHYDEILPDATRVAYKYGITLPREFLLILKQLLFFDRYAKLAAPSLNVFSDYQLVDFLFTPAAMEAGLDFNQLMPLLQKVQALTAASE
jgi:aarF domain-containing kinase